MTARSQNSVGKTSMASTLYRQQASGQMKQYHGNEIVELNVGGSFFATRYQTLATSNSSYFEAMFRIAETGRVVELPGSVLKDSSGRIFIDRDGELFRFVLQYMRDGKHTTLPQDPNHLRMIRREADFFGLQGLRQLIDKLFSENEKQPSNYLAYQRQQTAAIEEMTRLLQKLSQQQNVSNYPQSNGYRR